jgi:hypothetical protein
MGAFGSREEEVPATKRATTAITAFIRHWPVSVYRELRPRSLTNYDFVHSFIHSFIHSYSLEGNNNREKGGGMSTRGNNGLANQIAHASQRPAY